MDPNQPQTFTPHHDSGNQPFSYPPTPSNSFDQPAPHHEHHQEHHQPHHDAPHFPPQHHDTFQQPFQPIAPDQTPSFSMPPTPPASMPSFDMPTPPNDSPFDKATQSQPVVKVLSPFGVEYVFLALSLFFGATGLISALLILVNGAASFSALAFPAAMLLVTVPVFAFLFLRLKKLELRMPHLRLDASKRRTTQFIQIVSFITVISGLIGFVYSAFAKMAGQSGTSVGKAFLDMLCVVVVAGGILAYYWREEHSNRR